MSTEKGAHSASAVAEAEEQIDHVLGEEYEHKPVPLSARRSLFSVTMVWIGFPMIITGAMTGSVLVLGMGFQRALVAMVIGNIIMFAYVGSLGALGTKKGMNFALIASIVFGRKGYVFSSGLLSTLLLGWYAVQTGITGNLISSTYHLNYVLMTVIAGVLYIGITFVGVKRTPLYRPGVGAALRCARRLGRGGFGSQPWLGGSDVLRRRRRQRRHVDGRRTDDRIDAVR